LDSAFFGRKVLGDEEDIHGCAPRRWCES
jgi:hypothetical protein